MRHGRNVIWTGGEESAPRPRLMADMCEWRASGRAVGEQWRRDNSKKRRVAREQAPARLTGQRVSTPQDGGLITAKLAQAGGSRFCQEHLLACKKLSSLRQSRRRYAFASTTSIARDLALVLFRDFHRHRFHALDSIARDLALYPSSSFSTSRLHCSSSTVLPLPSLPSMPRNHNSERCLSSN